MENWKITKDRTKCCPMASQDEYYAVLELPSCVRKDLCAACFRTHESQSEKPPLFWKGRRRPDNKSGPVLDLASLRQLFDRLGDHADDEGAETAHGLRYLVALLLLRKRWLKMVDPRNAEEEKADLLVVDPKASDMEPVALIAPDLDDERLDVLKGELAAILGEQSAAE